IQCWIDATDGITGNEPLEHREKLHILSVRCVGKNAISRSNAGGGNEIVRGS
ncbi:hypothetical protein LCGC14_2882870, partial [marine sediment metagenome]